MNKASVNSANTPSAPHLSEQMNDKLTNGVKTAATEGNNNGCRVLIVGAGIAGLSMYRQLVAQGFTVELIEKSASWRTEGGAICLPANAILELEKLGLKAQVLAKAHQVSNIEYALAGGKTLTTASLNEAPLNKAPFVALMRSDLIAILQRGIQASEVLFSTTIASLTQHTSHVDITLMQAGAEVNKQYDVVIGADGIYSHVRQLTQPDTELFQPGITNWRFIADMPRPNMQPVYYLGAESAFMIYPMADNKVYCHGQIFDKNSQWYQQEAKQALSAIYQSYAPEVKSVVAQLNTMADPGIVKGKVHSVNKLAPVNQRVVLIGDAFHGCPASLQQGVGLGLEDVNCLAELLSSSAAHAKREIDIASILQQFAETRFERTNWVVTESNKINKLAGLGRFAIGRFLRNLKLKKSGPVNVLGWRKLLSEKAY